MTNTIFCHCGTGSFDMSIPGAVLVDIGSGLYKLRSVQNTGTCYPGQGWFVIGRSPGVPDKSSRGLGSMSRYSAQILICFIAYIFSIFNFSVGLVGNLAQLPPCTVPPATVHCYQNEAAQCSSDNQISQHALLRGSRKKHSLAFMPQNWWN